MRIRGIALMVCLAAFGQQTAVVLKPAARPRVDLVQLGDLVAVRPGSWIGLAPTRDGFGWVSYRTVVKDGRIELETSSGDAPLFLLRGLPQLAGKAVHTCFDRSETGSLHEQNPILLTCEARAYRLEVTNANRKLATAGASLLQFSYRGRTQTLFRWAAGLVDQRAEVVWAGDLDGDDRLDLVVDHGSLTLYMSSWAVAGQLVGRVAAARGN